MVKLRCNCLNICVETVGGNVREVDGTSFLSKRSTDSFFGEKLYEVKLAVGGIQKEMDLLIRQRQLEDWVVFKCLGCNTEVFALHSVKGEERVLVSQRVQSDPKKIAELMESKNRSPAFKIMLNPSTEEDLNVIGSGFSNDSITSAGTCVQEHIKRFLKSEEEAMEERIRCYTAEERKQFARVQSQAFNDKKVMLSILRKAAESKVEESLSDAMADVLKEGLENISEERPLRLPGGFIEDVTKIEILQASRYPGSPNKKESGTELEGDNFDPIFMADEECEPFVESDDEEYSDNSFNQKYEDEKARYSNRSKCSTSVPVNVPLFHRASHQHERFLDEDIEAPTPDKMAESIKALARSVRDSRDIFGDLPRPRVNTLTLPVT